MTWEIFLSILAVLFAFLVLRSLFLGFIFTAAVLGFLWLLHRDRNKL